MYNPSLRLKGHNPKPAPNYENLNRGRYQTLASADSGPTILALALILPQYSPIQHQLNDSQASFLIRSHASYGPPQQR